MITSPSCCSLAIGEWAESKLSRIDDGLPSPRPQPVQADDGSTGFDDVFYQRGEKSMRFRRLPSALLVVLAGSLFLTASVASGPKEDVAAATMKWAKTLGQHDPD